MSTKLLPVDIEDADDGAGGGVSAPTVRGGAMDNVDIVDDDGGEWPSPEAAGGGQQAPPPPPRESDDGAGGGGGSGGYVMRGPMLYRPDVAPPVNMDRVVQEAMPPSPQRDSVVQIIDDGGESAYDDASVAGDDVRTVQVDAGKKKPRKRGGGGKKAAASDPTKVVLDL
eukprot:jgi/Mesvir1/8755/Mv02674-RA.1